MSRIKELEQEVARMKEEIIALQRQVIDISLSLRTSWTHFPIYIKPYEPTYPTFEPVVPQVPYITWGTTTTSSVIGGSRD